LRCLCQALIAIVAIHTALSPARRLRRYLGGIIGVTLLSVVAPLAFDPSATRLWPWWYFARIDCAIGLYVLLALLLIRRQHWRFTRGQTREVATTRRA
jgi:integral membrane sensor domain MASE1